MSQLNSEDYPDSEYQETLEYLSIFTGILLFEFAREQLDVRETVIRNFISRADSMSKSIFQLWSMKNYHDCWILFRCLLERLFHLHHLNTQNEFELFEEWSFFQQQSYINKVRSSPEFDSKTLGKEFSLSEEDKKRVKELAQNPPKWQRPNAEKVAKALDMRFLYTVGYDFASTHVHPMASDGFEDFFNITGVEPAPNFPNQKLVLSNTLLVYTMVIQEGLDSGNFQWGAVIYDLLGDFRNSLKRQADYKPNFLKVVKLSEEKIPLCKR